jgi:hypothetical protein
LLSCKNTKILSQKVLYKIKIAQGILKRELHYWFKGKASGFSEEMGNYIVSAISVSI